MKGPSRAPDLSPRVLPSQNICGIPSPRGSSGPRPPNVSRLLGVQHLDGPLRQEHVPLLQLRVQLRGEEEVRISR